MNILNDSSYGMYYLRNIGDCQRTKFKLVPESRPDSGQQSLRTPELSPLCRMFLFKEQVSFFTRDHKPARFRKANGSKSVGGS